jgi:hypothetical protein
VTPLCHVGGAGGLALATDDIKKPRLVSAGVFLIPLVNQTE